MTGKLDASVIEMSGSAPSSDGAIRPRTTMLRRIFRPFRNRLRVDGSTTGSAEARTSKIREPHYVRNA